MRLVTRTLSALTPVAALALVASLSGCGGDYLYYQTRYIPTSSEQSFSPSAQWFWTENKEVYELPSNPPALASVEGQNDHRQRVDCKPPGPVFKPEALAKYGKGQGNGRGEVDGTEMASMGQPSGIPPAPKARDPRALGGWGNDHQYGPDEVRPVRVVGLSDKLPQVPLYTDGTIKPKPMATTGSDEGWCPPKQ